MTAAAERPAMRLVLAPFLVAAVCAACASKPPEPDWNAEPTPPAASTTQVVALYDLADLASLRAVDDLAADLRAQIVLLHGDDDPDPALDAHGATLVVRARPVVQWRLRNYFARMRRGVVGNAI